MCTKLGRNAFRRSLVYIFCLLAGMALFSRVSLANSELWVSNCNTVLAGAPCDSPTPGVLTPNVLIIDTTSNQIIDKLPVQSAGSIAFTPDGTRAYLTSGMQIDVYDTATKGRVVSIPFDCGISNIAFHPDGRYAYTACNKNNSGGVIKIDTSTNSVVNTVSGLLYGVGQLAITPDGTRVYANLSGSSPTADYEGMNTVAVIDTNTFEFQFIDLYGTGSEVSGIALAPDGKHAYVTEMSGGGIQIIDTDPSSSTYNTMISAVWKTYRYLQTIVISSDGYAYTAQGVADRVIKMDTKTNQLEFIGLGTELPYYPWGIAVSSDGKSLLSQC